MKHHRIENKLCYPLSRCPALVGFLVSRVTRESGQRMLWFLWNTIDHMSEPEPYWDALNANGPYKFWR